MRVQRTMRISVVFVSSEAQRVIAGRAVQVSRFHVPAARLSWERNLAMVWLLDQPVDVPGGGPEKEIQVPIVPLNLKTYIVLNH